MVGHNPGFRISGELGIDGQTGGALNEFPGQLLTQFNLVGVATAVVGLVAFVRRKQFSLLGFVCFGLFTFLLFNSVYHIGDIADYNTPIYFFASIALAAGVAFVLQILRNHSVTRNGILPAIALLAFLVVLPLQNLFGNFYVQDRSQDRETQPCGKRCLNPICPTMRF